MNKYLLLCQKLQLLFSPVISWIIPKGGDYCQKILCGSALGRHLQGLGMSCHNVPMETKSEQQNNCVWRAFCILRTECREKQLIALQAQVGVTCLGSFDAV